MNEREKEQLEEAINNVLEKALNCAKISISGRIVGKENNGSMITVKTEDGEVKVDINDGTTDTKTFQVGDALTNLPIQGAYLDIKEENLVFIFEGPSS